MTLDKDMAEQKAVAIQIELDEAKERCEEFVGASKKNNY